MPDKKSSKLPKVFIEFIKPSELSAIFCVVASFAICLGALFINRYRPGRLNLVSHSLKETISSSYLTGSLTQDTAIKDLPLIFFTVAVVILVWLLAMDLKKLSKKKLKANKFLLRTLARLAALLLSFPYLYFFFYSLLAYITKIAIFATGTANVLGVAGYVILSAVISSVAIYINILLLRLLLLKKRLIDI